MIAIDFIGKSNERKFNNLKEIVEFDYQLNFASINSWKNESLILLKEDKVLDLLDNFFIEDLQEWHVTMFSKNIDDANYVYKILTASDYFLEGVQNLKKYNIDYFCEVKKYENTIPLLKLSEVCLS